MSQKDGLDLFDIKSISLADLESRSDIHGGTTNSYSTFSRDSQTDSKVSAV